MLEIICTSYEDVLNAINGGANRIELIDEFHLGGTTPSFDLIKKAISLGVEVNVMLRCRGGDFCYTDEEVEKMRCDAIKMKSLGVKCVVFGALNEKGLVDREALDKVIGSVGLDMTFHRALDESSDIIINVLALNEISYVKNILTSGGVGKAFDNLDKINEIIKCSNKNIIVGSGVNSDNIDYILENVTSKCDIHVGSGAREGGRVSDKMVRKLRRFEK